MQTKSPTFNLLLAVSVCLLLSAAAQGVERLRVDSEHVRTWNQFAEDVHALHKDLIGKREVREEMSTGGYANQPDFYQEVKYYDRDSGHLISMIQRDRSPDKRLHTIEVYVRDEQGRVIRDYAAAYLPEHRNAPVQTLINLHHYDGDLHGFRQFDASGDLIYEFCEGTHAGEEVQIRLFEDDIYGVSERVDRLMRSEPYLRCFGEIPKRADAYLSPR